MIWFIGMMIIQIVLFYFVLKILKYVDGDLDESDVKASFLTLIPYVGLFFIFLIFVYFIVFFFRESKIFKKLCKIIANKINGDKK